MNLRWEDGLAQVIASGRPLLQHYGLYAVGLGIFTETLLFTGIVVPGYGILVAAGYLVAAGLLPAWPVIGLAWLGGLLGDQGSYLVGYWFGHRLLRRKQAFAERLRQALEQEGPALLLWYHYAPALRAVLPCVAGSARYQPRRWLLFDAIGVSLWVLAVLALGMTAHGALAARGNIAAQAANAVAGLLMVWASWRIARRVRRFQQPAADGNEPAGPPPGDDESSHTSR